jgi:hypothetical protein
MGDKVTLCRYNYDKGRTKPHNPGMRKSKSYKLIPTPEQLATRFLGEVVAATAGTQGFAEQSDALRGYLETLQPHRRMEDYWRSGAMPQPWPLQFLIDGYTLYAFFRAWLRKEGIDPDLTPPPIPGDDRFAEHYYRPRP